MSLQYDRESNLAMSELYYIQQKAGKVIQPLKMDRLREMGEQYGFPIGADKDVLGLSYHYGKLFAEKGNTAGARYCWGITCGLTNDEAIRTMSDDLPAEQE